MRWLLHCIFGWFRVVCPRGAVEKVLNTLLENGANSWGYYTADDVFELSVGRKGERILKANFADLTFEAKGAPVYLKSLLRRPGLLLGGVFALAIFLLGTTLVWDIRIEGNQKISDAVIEQALSEAGLSVGMQLADVDRERITLAVLENEKSVSYLAINLRGGVAYVKVMENATPPSSETHTGGANLVASCDALIDSLAVRRGETCVRAGQVVRKGELLVSGVTDAHAGNRLLYAEGEVFGRVKESFTVTVPLQSDTTVQKGKKTVGFLLNFFGKTINIFDRGGNLPSSCGTIYNWERYMLPGDVALPFSFAYVTEPETENVTATLKQSEAVACAVRLANERLARELENGELISRTLDGAFTENAYVLTCEYVCVKNIAKTQEFEIN